MDMLIKMDVLIKMDAKQFDTNQIEIIKGDQYLVHLLDDQMFKNFLTKNYNQGILYSINHFLLPTLIFTGNVSNYNIFKKIYVNWRLLSNSIAIVFEDMITENYLKSKSKLLEKLSEKLSENNIALELFRIFKNINLKDKMVMKNLFWSSYLYFGNFDSSGFENLIDKNNNNFKDIWQKFNEKYYSIAKEQKEQIESDFDKMYKMKEHYNKWWNSIYQFSRELDLKLIEEFITQDMFIDIGSEIKNMYQLFEKVWMMLLEPLFFNNFYTEIPISIEDRKNKAFKRFMIYNLLVLISNNIDVTDLIDELSKKEIDIQKIINMY